MGIISTNQKKATPTTIALNAVTEAHLLRTSVTYFRHKSNFDIKLAAIYLHSLLLVHVQAAAYQLQHKAAASASMCSCSMFFATWKPPSPTLSRSTSLVTAQHLSSNRDIFFESLCLGDGTRPKNHVEFLPHLSRERCGWWNQGNSHESSMEACKGRKSTRDKCQWVLHLGETALPKHTHQVRFERRNRRTDEFLGYQME